jgi:hypothetical protein
MVKQSARQEASGHLHMGMHLPLESWIAILHAAHWSPRQGRFNYGIGEAMDDPDPTSCKWSPFSNYCQACASNVTTCATTDKPMR